MISIIIGQGLRGNKHLSMHILTFSLTFYYFSFYFTSFFLCILQLYQGNLLIYIILMQQNVQQLGLKYNANESMKNLEGIESEFNPRLRSLQGECKVKLFRALKFSYVKTFILIIPLIVSFIGLLLLKYYKSFRARCFYTECSDHQAEYFFIESVDGHQQIEKVISQNANLFVYFKSLKYQYIKGAIIPYGYEFEEDFPNISSKKYLSSGLSEQERQKQGQRFGRNEHIVQVPNYFEYMFDTLTKPFFLFQYCICIIYVFERLFLYAGISIGFSLLTTSINYILLFRSYEKIKAIAEKQTDVAIIRSGKRVIVKNHEVVPGDVVIPVKNEELSYDGILIEGQVFVNEASLTGESIPVGKFPAYDLAQTNKESCWLVQGAKVLQAREESRVVVVNIGYATRRGRIIRKILTRIPKVPDFFLSAVYFLFQTLAIGVIIYASTVNMMIKNGIITTFVVFRFLDTLAWSFPPTFPIYFNLSYSFSLVRLKWKNIFGTQPEKVTEAAMVKTFCFDKTGTLTQNQIEVYSIIKFVSQSSHQTITNSLNDRQNTLISKLFSSCHTTRQADEEFLGDEVDLRMFLHSQYTMTVSQDPNIRFVVKNSQNDQIQVLRINQFQSKFQNMSVLVRDVKLNKFFVFVKGAPERIQKHSVIKYSYFEGLVKHLSLGGYRTIAYAYKEIQSAHVSRYLQKEREIFEEGITALGLVAFQNKLKVDTRITIDRLIQSDIEPKMITGDNIFIAVQTGFRAGILKPAQKILVLQGRKQEKYENGLLQGILLFKQKEDIVQQNIEISLQEYHSSTNYAIAVDNDFLTMKPEPRLVPSIKLFARISPQNKALIVKNFKILQESTFKERSFRERAFGKGRWKVGMCGDGANDLMAIRQADIGIGISDSDAGYGASFTIGNMQDVEQIVRQSKNASQSIIDTIRYYGTISFLRIIAGLILASDVTYFNATQIVYFNFAHSLFLSLFFSLSSAAQKPTPKRPNCNLMSFQNHVIYWSNIIFPSIGFFAAYYYFYSTKVFISNDNIVVTIQAGYTGVFCYTNTVVWLILNLPFIFNAFIIYRSDPFKCKMHRNLPIFLLFALNAIAAIVYFFTTSTKVAKTFGLFSLPGQESGIVFLIMSVCIVVSYLFNEWFKYVYEAD